jgi:hypothetical protein
MGIGPIFGIFDSLANPRRIEGIGATHFEIGASARTGDDRPPTHQHTSGQGMADDDDGLESELDQEQDEVPEESGISVRGTQVNFIV